MTDTTSLSAGLLLIAVPLAFNLAFAALAARFDYPDVLRAPTAEVLERFRAGGTSLVLLWWAFALTALAMVPLVVLVGRAIPQAGTLTTTVGVLAALVQVLGLVRWPFLVPYLAREAAGASPERQEAIDVVFQSFHRFLGVGVGEHLGYALTGAWTVLGAAAISRSDVVPGVLFDPGVVIGALLVLCSLEFVGPHEPDGWSLAARLVPATYVAWSLWLVAIGIALVA